MRNNALCSLCWKVVPTDRVVRDGKVYLIKHCKDCGDGETLISNNAERAEGKRALDHGFDYHGCAMDCPSCSAHGDPRFAFVNTTNRCNLDCPICFDNVPGLGFEFEPPIEYFDQIFKALSELENPPSICLFGGEPTVRDDLFEIIALSRSYNLKTRVFTNGVRLADEDYCKALLQTKVEILFSYDGEIPEMYAELRGSAKVLDKKRRGLENIRKHRKLGRKRITMVTVLAKGLNEHELPSLLGFVHERRDFIGTIYLLPLIHTWDNADWDYDPPRMTTEDIEDLTQALFPDERIDFLPLGFVHELAAAMALLGRDVLPYGGAHPNCESMYYLISDGEKWQPVARYLKRSVGEVAEQFSQLADKLTRRQARWQTGFLGRLFGAIGLRGTMLKLLGVLNMNGFIMRNVSARRMLKGRGPMKLLHMLAMPFDMALRGARRALPAHTNFQGELRVCILPLEDKHVLETERLERCPTQQVYVDPDTQEVKYMPLCSFKLHNKRILRGIADHYAKK